MTHKEQLINRVAEYLDSQHWRYKFSDNKEIVRFDIDLKSKLKSCSVFICIGEYDIQIFTICPINASKDVYGNVVEFITRANPSLKLGKFLFDYSNGEIRYQCGMACGGSVPSLADVERCVDVGFVMFGHYGDGLVQNLMGYGDPEAQIKAIDG